MRLSILERTAYHEAGHAVAAIEQKRSLHCASIVADGDSLGRVTYGPQGKSFALRVVQKSVFCALAGNVSEKVFTGRFNHISAAEDFEYAFELASFLYGHGKECNDFLAQTYGRTLAWAMSSSAMPQIDAVAKALLDKNNSLEYESGRSPVKHSKAAWTNLNGNDICNSTHYS